MPDWQAAYVPDEKLTGYLLSETHAVGKWKAQFFRSFGFAQDQASVLKKELLRIARVNEVTSQVRTGYGTKYIIDGNLMTPIGLQVRIRTVWIVEHSDPRPRFVTAYAG